MSVTLYHIDILKGLQRPTPLTLKPSKGQGKNSPITQREETLSKITEEGSSLLGKVTSVYNTSITASN